MCLHRHPPLPRQTCHTVHGAKYVCIYTHTYRFSSVSLSHTVSHTRSILEMMTREIRATEKREKKTPRQRQLWCKNAMHFARTSSGRPQEFYEGKKSQQQQRMHVTRCAKAFGGFCLGIGFGLVLNHMVFSSTFRLCPCVVGYRPLRCVGLCRVFVPFLLLLLPINVDRQSGRTRLCVCVARYPVHSIPVRASQPTCRRFPDRGRCHHS